MPEEVKAAEKPPSSLVGDVTRAIHDAWEFFLPATLRLLGAGLIVYWLAGKVLAGAFFTGIKAALVSVNVHFGKFLILWSVGWTIALAHRPGVPHGIIVRLFVILVAITYWITVNLVLAAYSIEQTTYVKVNATVALLTLEGKDEISAHDERRTRIDSSIQSTYPNHAWWWLQINSLQSLHTLRDVDLQRAIGRRQAGGPR